MKSERSSSSKFIRYIKAPIRALCRARDFYVNSLTQCSSRIHYGAAMGCPAGVVYTLPRSFSMNSSRSKDDEDIRELIRAVSRRRQGEKPKPSPVPVPRSRGLPKSFSVRIGRIDEDKPCCFEEDLKVNVESVLYARSRSYAMIKKKHGMLY